MKDTTLKSLSEEKFKDIPDYINFYQVSNMGRVKSLERIIIRNNGTKLSIKERILSTTIDYKGYLRSKLCKDGVSVPVHIHQLVARAFLNHKPNGNKIVIDHIDNDVTNNNVNNLQIITNRENCSKDKKGGTSKYIGVSWSKKSGKWQSKIYYNGKHNGLGLFNSELEASEAYNKQHKLLNL